MNEKENWGSNLPPDLKDAEIVECRQCGEHFCQETDPDDFVCNQCKREEDCDEIS
jgi:formylmethanofuran dehydrogenase subunit E